MPKGSSFYFLFFCNSIFISYVKRVSIFVCKASAIFARNSAFRFVCSPPDKNLFNVREVTPTFSASASTSKRFFFIKNTTVSTSINFSSSLKCTCSISVLHFSIFAASYLLTTFPLYLSIPLKKIWQFHGFVMTFSFFIFVQKKTAPIHVCIGAVFFLFVKFLPPSFINHGKRFLTFLRRGSTLRKSRPLRRRTILRRSFPRLLRSRAGGYFYSEAARRRK